MKCKRAPSRRPMHDVKKGIYFFLYVCIILRTVVLHSKQQLLYSYNADDTVVKPIDWGSILHADPLPQSPQEVRAYRT